VQTEVDKAIPRAGVFGIASHAGISGNASDTKLGQQISRTTSKPTFVPWFESNILIVHFAKQCKESSSTVSIKFKARRKLKQDGAELLPQKFNLLQEIFQLCAMRPKQAFVCYCFWSLDGKLKVLGHRFRPALPRLESMGTVETGVDLGAEESSRVSLQMSTVACEFGSELLRNIPTRTPDSEIQHEKALP
jgi:hypothetical protein